MKDINHPEQELLSVYREHGVVKRSDRDDNFNKAALDRSIYQLVHSGWLVVNRMKAWQGSVGISSHTGIVSGHYICFRPNHTEDHRFLNWLFRSTVYTAEYSSLSRGVRPNQVEIDNDWLRSLRVMLPPIEEQRRIADFLDAETARLDALTTLRSQQIALLQASLESVTTEAIDASPGRSVRLKYLTKKITSGPRGWGELTVNSGSPFLRITNIPRQGITLDLRDLLYVDAPPGPERERSRTQINDVLVSITADIGSVALIDERGKDGNISQHVALVRPADGLCDPHWLAYALKSTRSRQALQMNSYGGTKMGLGLGDVANLALNVPSLATQQSTAMQITRSLDRRNALQVALARQGQLLKERRKALITAAVTGQFDVSTASGRNVTDGVPTA
ncbi:restriction endonuclease subunit S [Streptomyces sp. NBC_00341]|uniref:restriction endonuclease subunit S n=1 Tax=Streptomyces sp. NBC_00341 TaxID=2975717 RepID=UPI00308A8C41|nr:restriction endonuclease subunit S [Streptomyces sp. NBC_00341]